MLADAKVHYSLSFRQDHCSSGANASFPWLLTPTFPLADCADPAVPTLLPPTVTWPDPTEDKNDDHDGELTLKSTRLTCQCSAHPSCVAVLLQRCRRAAGNVEVLTRNVLHSTGAFGRRQRENPPSVLMILHEDQACRHLRACARVASAFGVIMREPSNGTNGDCTKPRVYDGESFPSLNKAESDCTSEHLLGAVQCCTVVLERNVDAADGAFLVGLCILDMFGNTIDNSIIDLSNRSNLSRSMTVTRQHV